MIRANIRGMVALMAVTLFTAAAGAQMRQPTNIKGAEVELYSDPSCDHENGQVITKKEAAALRVLEESGRSVRVRCGNKEGWVDRQDLVYELPPSRDTRPPTAGGSGRGLQ